MLTPSQKNVWSLVLGCGLNANFKAMIIWRVTFGVNRHEKMSPGPRLHNSVLSSEKSEGIGVDSAESSAPVWKV